MIRHYKNFSLDPIEYTDCFGNKHFEEWFDIVGFEGLYQVSDLCRIRSLDRKCISVKKNGDCFYRFLKGKIMGQTIEKDFYLRINLTDINKKTNRFASHRLLAIAAIPNPENKPEVNHKDGIKWNNCIDNLEWVTDLENVAHAIENGLIISQKGEKHGCSKLTEKEVLEIRAIGKSMLQKDIAILYNVDRTTITNILSRKTWNHL